MSSNVSSSMRERVVLATGATFLGILAVVAAPPRRLVRDVDAVAKALRSRDTKQAKALARIAARNEDEPEHFMHFFESADRGFGIALGERERRNVERTLSRLAEKKLGFSSLKTHRNELEAMAYRIAAVGLICENLPPRRERGKRTRARWLNYSQGLYENAQILAKALANLDSEGVQRAAARVNGTCRSCHRVFD